MQELLRVDETQKDMADLAQYIAEAPPDQRQASEGEDLPGATRPAAGVIDQLLKAKSRKNIDVDLIEDLNQVVSCNLTINLPHLVCIACHSPSVSSSGGPLHLGQQYHPLD